MTYNNDPAFFLFSDSANTVRLWTIHLFHSFMIVSQTTFTVDTDFIRVVRKCITWRIWPNNIPKKAFDDERGAWKSSRKSIGPVTVSCHSRQKVRVLFGREYISGRIDGIMFVNCFRQAQKLEMQTFFNTGILRMLATLMRCAFWELRSGYKT